MGKKQKQQRSNANSDHGGSNTSKQQSKNKQQQHQQQNQYQQQQPSSHQHPPLPKHSTHRQQQQQQQSRQQFPPQYSQNSSQNSNSNNNSSSLWSKLERWLRAEQQGILWVVGCVTLGCLFGFGIGSGWLTGQAGPHVAPWRIELGTRIRGSLWYAVLLDWNAPPQVAPPTTTSDAQLHPSHPRVYAVLREAVIREQDGFVHPDLGLMIPAPCGAPRGLGMISTSWHDCQSACLPGVASEKVALQRNQKAKLAANPENTTLWYPPIPDHPVYKQEEVLVRVPLSFQMTRQVALDTLLARLPGDVQRKAAPHELDDAALLVLLLAHERGVGRHSRWLPYIASLPQEPSCGYSPNVRASSLVALKTLQDELGVDTYGWKGELNKAHKHAVRIAHGLAKDYGAHILHPDGMTAVQNLEWALCQVTSRATAGSELYGSLRLVPLMDMINHDAAAGGFVELTGKERLAHGDFIEATEDGAGSFVVRSIRHGRRKALKKGQELLVNYNVPHYSPLDWFVSLGFVPPERQAQWTKLDAALPRMRQDSYGILKGVANMGGEEAGGGSTTTSTSSAELWEQEYGPQMLAQYKEQQKKKRNKHKTATTNTAAKADAGGTTPTTTTTTNKDEQSS